VTDRTPTVFLLPGAGGEALDPILFTAGPRDLTAIARINYPGWARCIEEGFSADVLIADLAAQIAAKVPHGPIRIVGFSIGGHFGYAAALRLQENGRKIAGFCAIDTFMMGSAPPSAGVGRRALARGFSLLREYRSLVVNRCFWRVLLKMPGGRLPSLLRGLAPSGRLPRILAFDPSFEQELSMRLLIRATGPWIATLDRDPVALAAPAIFLRTRRNARDDAAWRRRCPGIEVIEIPGQHETLFEPENVGLLRERFIAATNDWRCGAVLHPQVRRVRDGIE